MRIPILTSLILAASLFAAESPLGKPYTTLTGKTTTLVSEGKYVLLDFWASWCNSCRFSVQTMNRILTTNPKIKVIGINMDEPQDFTKATGMQKATKMAFPTYIDQPELLSEVYGISTLPAYVLLSPEGKLVQQWKGDVENLLQQLDELVGR